MYLALYQDVLPHITVTRHQASEWVGLFYTTTTWWWSHCRCGTTITWIFFHKIAICIEIQTVKRISSTHLKMGKHLNFFRFRQFSSPKWQDLCDQQRSGTAHMDAFFVRSWKAQERRKGTGWGISRYSRLAYIHTLWFSYTPQHPMGGGFWQ